MKLCAGDVPVRRETREGRTVLGRGDARIGDRCREGMREVHLGIWRDTSIAELAHAIREIVGFEGEFRFDPSKPDGMPFKALDSSELRALGWQPSVAFHDALDRTYRWFLSHDTRLVAET